MRKWLFVTTLVFSLNTPLWAEHAKNAGSAASKQSVSLDLDSALAILEAATKKCETTRENFVDLGQEAAEYLSKLRLNDVATQKRVSDAFLRALELEKPCAFNGILGYRYGLFLKSNPVQDKRLLEIAKSHPYYWSRQAALRALGGLGAADSIEATTRAETLSSLQSLLDNPPADTRPRQKGEIGNYPQYLAEIFRQYALVSSHADVEPQDKLASLGRLAEVLKAAKTDSIADGQAMAIRTSALGFLLLRAKPEAEWVKEHLGALDSKLRTNLLIELKETAKEPQQQSYVDSIAADLRN